MDPIYLKFFGWFDNLDVKQIPEEDGIYIAHAIKWADSDHNHFNIVKLVYIGMASGTDNLQVRINQHITGADRERNDNIWLKALQDKGIKADTIEYSYALYNEENLHDVETALIYANENNGILNDQGTHGHDNANAKKLEITIGHNSGHLMPHEEEMD